MLYEISKEVGTELAAKGCPYPVVYGPERIDEVRSLGTPRVVFERDRERGDGVELNMRARTTNPKMTAIRPLGAIVRVFAQETLVGAAVHDHERVADQVVDKLLVALRKVVATRRTLWRVLTAKLLGAEEVNARGLETWPGVVYELRLEVDRGVFDTTWVGSARAEVTAGDDFDITTTDQIFPTPAPEGATPETAC